MLFKIPFLNELYNFFLTPWGLVTAILLILLAFSGEFWNIYKLSHKKEEELPEVTDETLQKAIESYKSEKRESELDLPDNVLRELKLIEESESVEELEPVEELELNEELESNEELELNEELEDKQTESENAEKQ